jgi:hypothetical protein
MNKLFLQRLTWVMGIATLFFGLSLPASAQTSQTELGQCIFAGRISGFGRWAPRLVHLELIDDKGQQVLDEASEALATVKHVRVNSATLLVTCNRDKPGPKIEASATVPAVSAGSEVLAVKALSLVPVGIGGHWVELELVPNQARVIRVPSLPN